MGLLANFSVYMLMVIPIAAMLRGHKISFTRLILLAFVSVALQFTEPLLLSVCPDEASSNCVVLRVAIRGMLLPFIQALFFTFALNDSKASKVLHLVDCGDGDAAAALATVWCLVYTIVHRWFGWYHTMGSLAYEEENLISAANAFLSLVTTLTMARRLCGHDGAAAVLCVVAAHAIGQTFGILVAVPCHLVAPTVTAALLLAGRAVFPTVKPQQNEKLD